MDPPYIHQTRSHDHLLALEEGIAGKLLKRIRNETSSGLAEVIMRSTRKPEKSSCCSVVVEFMKKNGRVIICMTSLLLDALPIYMLGVMENGVCFKFNKIVAVVAVVLLTVFDLFYIYPLKVRYDLQDSERRYSLWHLIDFVLPIPQIIASIMIRWRGARNWLMWSMLYLFLLLKHLRKSIPVVIWSKKALTSGNLADCSLMFVFYYVYASQLYGALWYLLALYRKFQCWNDACSKHLIATQDQCFHYIFTGHYHSHQDLNKVKQSCDIGKYDHYGMVEEALKSGILSTGVSQWKKMLYCFRQGLQHLSSLGSNLQAGLDIAGNFYAIGVFMFGMLSLSLLIGVIQMIQQSNTKRFAARSKNLEEIEQWMPFQNLSKDLQEQIKKYQHAKWRETKFLHLENMLNNLSKELRRELTHELGLKLLKKVDEFKSWGKSSLQELCDHLKPVFFVERTRVIRQGDPIDEIVFVVEGVLWAYPSGGRTTGFTKSRSRNRKNDYIKAGDFCGKELLNWAQVDPYSPDFPVSTKTIRALTNVEAFVLMAHDLRNIFIKHLAVLFIQLRWRFIRFLRSKIEVDTLLHLKQAPATQSR